MNANVSKYELLMIPANADASKELDLGPVWSTRDMSLLDNANTVISKFLMAKYGLHSRADISVSVWDDSRGDNCLRARVQILDRRIQRKRDFRVKLVPHNI